MPELLAAASSHGFRIGLVGTALALGLRHGVDWDHIAAITDITSSQSSPRRGFVFSTLYAFGHAAVVLALGVVAILAGDLVPEGVEAVMERVVGATLVLLGGYVLYALLRYGRDFRLRSRWMLVFSSVRRGARWLRAKAAPPPRVIEVVHDHDHPVGAHAHREAAVAATGHADVVEATRHGHPHRHTGSLPDDPFASYGRGTSFGVGMIHGVGAETPTQMLIFLTAVGVGGRGAGVVLLVAFIVGLLVSNSLIALGSSFGLVNASRNFALYATISVLVAVFSLGLGMLYLLGGGSVLPGILA